jgi:hypothetical protein
VNSCIQNSRYNDLCQEEKMPRAKLPAGPPFSARFDSSPPGVYLLQSAFEHPDLPAPLVVGSEKKTPASKMANEIGTPEPALSLFVESTESPC